MSDRGILFFNKIDVNAIGCWNSASPYRREHLDEVCRDEEALIFPSDVKVDRHRNVWVISDKMPVFLMSTLNYTDVNFRIMFAPEDVLVKDTMCNYGIASSIEKVLGKSINSSAYHVTENNL